MTPARRILFIFGTTLAICAAYAGYLLSEKHREPSPPPAAAAPPAPDNALGYWSFNDLEGRERHMSEWAGQLVVVNFWATWCPPCRKEIPGFIALQEQFGDAGVQFVGIALDRVDAVTQYVADTGMNYPALVGEAEVTDYMRALGNTIGALPFTALVDRDGAIVTTHQGEWHQADVADALREAGLREQ